MRFNEETQQLITCSKDKTIKVWQLPLRWIDEQTKGKSEDAGSVLQPSDEDYKDFIKGGYQQDFRTGIDESLWSENVIRQSETSPVKKEEEKQSSSEKETTVGSGSKTKIQNESPAKEEKTFMGSTSLPTNKNKYEDENDESDDDGLTGWNK